MANRSDAASMQPADRDLTRRPARDRATLGSEDNESTGLSTLGSRGLHIEPGNTLIQQTLAGGLGDFGGLVATQLGAQITGIVDPDVAMGSNQAMLRLMRASRDPHGPVVPSIPSGGGSPLPSRELVRFSEAFQHDLSDVRIHIDGQAAKAAGALSAHAFAVGSDIYFAAGEFAPGTPKGDRLLAHELTHVVQHQEGRLAGTEGVSSPTDPAEKEAYANESRILGRLNQVDGSSSVPQGSAIFDWVGAGDALPPAVAGRVSATLGEPVPPQLLEGPALADLHRLGDNALIDEVALESGRSESSSDAQTGAANTELGVSLTPPSAASVSAPSAALSSGSVHRDQETLENELEIDEEAGVCVDLPEDALALIETFVTRSHELITSWQSDREGPELRFSNAAAMKVLPGSVETGSRSSPTRPDTRSTTHRRLSRRFVAGWTSAPSSSRFGRSACTTAVCCRPTWSWSAWSMNLSCTSTSSRPCSGWSTAPISSSWSTGTSSGSRSPTATSLV